MRRQRGQQALYEAISRSRRKSRRRGILERLRPHSDKADEPVAAKPKPQEAEPLRPAALKPPRPAEHRDPSPGPAQTWLHPKAVQFNAGRIDISVPYALGITIGLAFVTVVLAAYRFGQLSQKASYGAQMEQSGRSRQPAAPNAATATARQPGTDVPQANTQAGTPDAATPADAPRGDHVIVLAQYSQRDDLEKAQEYFAQHEIETVVISVAALRQYFASLNLNVNLGQGDGYMLVTADYYENPEVSGTDGFQAKQRIIDVGRGYNAPAGYESFARHHFSDAYGMKIR